MKLKHFTLPICKQHPIVIAGPCAAETEEQVFETAKQLKERGIVFFRAGVWKPRTRPCSFEGIGEEALPWLVRVKNELHMTVATEVATPEHIKYALQNAVDRRTDNSQSICRSANCRYITRNKRTRTGKESSQSRFRTMDRGVRTTGKRWGAAFGCYSSWFLYL